MRSRLPHLVILALFALILGLPFAARPPTPADDPEALRLVIISPHNEPIRFETARAFSRWHQEHHGRPVEIDWRDVGGTTDIERTILSRYRQLAREGRIDQGVGIDLVFGGGDFFFDAVLKPGVGDGRSVLQPIDLEPDFIREVYPTVALAGKKLYDPEGYWWGVVLSSFGIVYNRDVLGLLGLPEPATWADLADPDLAGWVALADPGHSGSIRVTYDAIVQRYGWDRGWATLRRAAANARYFARHSSKVPVDVAAGEAAAGMSIDFYGRYQAQTVGGERVGYIAPAGQTVVTADPIAVLRGAEHPRLAGRFVRFLLTRQGQALWNFRAGAEVDDLRGPVRFELRRSPIRRDMYDRYLDYMIDPVNPFELAAPLPEDTPSYFSVMTVVLHAMAIDVHEDLRAAWAAVNRQTDPRRRAEMLRAFDRLPFTEAQLLAAPDRWSADRAARIRDRLEWTRFFRDRYRAVVRMADD